MILTRPADDLPIGAGVRVAGYFVMVRQYYSASQRVQQALLIVARAPIEVAMTGAPPSRQRDPWPWLAATAAGLLLAWMILRRTAPRAGGADRPLRARSPAPDNAATEFREWASRELPGDAGSEGDPPRA